MIEDHYISNVNIEEQTRNSRRRTGTRMLMQLSKRLKKGEMRVNIIMMKENYVAYLMQQEAEIRSRMKREYCEIRSRMKREYCEAREATALKQFTHIMWHVMEQYLNQKLYIWRERVRIHAEEKAAAWNAQMERQVMEKSRRRVLQEMEFILRRMRMAAVALNLSSWRSGVKEHLADVNQKMAIKMNVEAGQIKLYIQRRTISMVASLKLLVEIFHRRGMGEIVTTFVCWQQKFREAMRAKAIAGVTGVAMRQFAQFLCRLAQSESRLRLEMWRKGLRLYRTAQENILRYQLGLKPADINRSAGLRHISQVRARIYASKIGSLLALWRSTMKIAVREREASVRASLVKQLKDCFKVTSLRELRLFFIREESEYIRERLDNWRTDVINFRRENEIELKKQIYLDGELARKRLVHTFTLRRRYISVKQFQKGLAWIQRSAKGRAIIDWRDNFRRFIGDAEWAIRAGISHKLRWEQQLYAVRQMTFIVCQMVKADAQHRVEIWRFHWKMEVQQHEMLQRQDSIVSLWKIKLGYATLGRGPHLLIRWWLRMHTFELRLRLSNWRTGLWLGMKKGFREREEHTENVRKAAGVRQCKSTARMLQGTIQRQARRAMLANWHKNAFTDMYFTLLYDEIIPERDFSVVKEYETFDGAWREKEKEAAVREMLARKDHRKIKLQDDFNNPNQIGPISHNNATNPFYGDYDEIDKPAKGDLSTLEQSIKAVNDINTYKQKLSYQQDVLDGCLLRACQVGRIANTREASGRAVLPPHEFGDLLNEVIDDMAVEQGQEEETMSSGSDVELDPHEALREEAGFMDPEEAHPYGNPRVRNIRKAFNRLQWTPNTKRHKDQNDQNDQNRFIMAQDPLRELGRIAKLTEADRDLDVELDLIFDSLDKNGDGVITQSEWDAQSHKEWPQTLKEAYGRGYPPLG